MRGVEYLQLDSDASLPDFIHYSILFVCVRTQWANRKDGHVTFSACRGKLAILFMFDHILGKLH